MDFSNSYLHLYTVVMNEEADDGDLTHLRAPAAPEALLPSTLLPEQLSTARG